MSKKKDEKLRDLFALAAMTPLAHDGRLKDASNPGPETTVEAYRLFAKEVWKLADAMLLERGGQSKEVGDG